MEPFETAAKPGWTSGDETSMVVVGDSLAFMETLAPDSIDCIWTDPPYLLSNDGVTCVAGRMVKVNKGTELDREWLKFRDEIWLPARSETRFQARVFLAMGFHFLRVEEFSDYKKFSSTSTFKIEGAP